MPPDLLCQVDLWTIQGGHQVTMNAEKALQEAEERTDGKIHIEHYHAHWLRFGKLPTENGLLNLAHYPRSLQPQVIGKYVSAPEIIVWGAGPSLDWAVEEADKGALWPRINQRINLVCDSAIPRLKDTPLKADFHGSIDPSPLKEGMVKGADSILLAPSQAFEGIVKQAKNVCFALDSIGIIGKVPSIWRMDWGHYLDVGRFLYLAARKFWPVFSSVLAVGYDLTPGHYKGFDVPENDRFKRTDATGWDTTREQWDFAMNVWNSSPFRPFGDFSTLTDFVDHDIEKKNDPAMLEKRMGKLDLLCLHPDDIRASYLSVFPFQFWENERAKDAGVLDEALEKHPEVLDEILQAQRAIPELQKFDGAELMYEYRKHKVITAGRTVVDHCIKQVIDVLTDKLRLTDGGKK